MPSESKHNHAVDFETTKMVMRGYTDLWDGEHLVICLECSVRRFFFEWR